MPSIISTVSAQFTQNIFSRLDVDHSGYLDKPVLQRALRDMSQDEVDTLLQTLDKDGDQRITPHELHLAIFDWLTAPKVGQVLPSFATLVSFYGPD